MDSQKEDSVTYLRALGGLTDKVQNGFVDAYRSQFQDLVDQPVRLLEIGIFKGGSLLLWDLLFQHPQARIIGIDLALPDIELPERVSMYPCDQNDSEGLKTIAQEHGPFDVVIDDCSHYAQETRNCFNVLIDHICPGGYYVIEDWCVGYWSDMQKSGILPSTFKEMYRPEFDGMVKVITDIMENAIRLQLRGLNIQVVDKKCLACFQKAT